MRIDAVRVASGALLAGCAVAMFVGPATAKPAQAPDTAEAWYSTFLVPPTSLNVPDVCGLLPTCPLDLSNVLANLVPSPYPAGTLHIESASGKISAQAYVVPDLSAVPQDAKDARVVMTLPVTQAQDAGNLNVADADLVACPAKAEVSDGVYGGIIDAPGFDCDRAQAPARFDEETHSFTLDLTPLLTDWKPGSPAPGIALVPAPDAGSTSSWKVSLNGAHASEKPGISTTVRLQQEASTPPAPSPQSSAPPSGTANTPVDGNDLGAGDALPPVADEKAPKAAPPVKASVPAATKDKHSTPQPAPVALVSSKWYAARSVVLLPLALLAALGLSGHTLTRRQVLRARD